jgi:hypothetical protein
VRVGVTRAGALSILLLAATTAHAQAPTPPQVQPPMEPAAASPVLPQAPQPGFVSPYEIMRTVRAAGFNPLSRPLREGTTYVVRATDFRGILMRVVIDARSGAIRDANRIVSDAGLPDQIGMIPSYESPPNGGMPLGMRPEAPERIPGAQGAVPPPPVKPPAARTVMHPAAAARPPLPRVRPAELAERKPVKPAVNAQPQAETKPEIKTDVITAVPPAATKPSKAPPEPPIND